MAKKRLLQRIQDQLQASGLTAKSRAARNWLMSKLNNIRLNKTAKTAFVNGSTNSISTPNFNTKMGTAASSGVKMFMFFYDPKLKQQLPFYDTFPLVIPLATDGKSMLGLNLHYLYPRQRAILLDKLEAIMTDRNYDENTKMRISYALIKNSSRYYETRPCIKRYLYNHVRSKFLEINADEWENVVFLPFEQFQKQSKEHVWNDSASNYY